jgi:hypothetical protein
MRSGLGRIGGRGLVDASKVKFVCMDARCLLVCESTSLVWKIGNERLKTFLFMAFFEAYGEGSGSAH